MSGEAWLYLFAVLINAVNLFLQVFFTIMYSDLEWCVRLRTFVFSDYYMHTIHIVHIAHRDTAWARASSLDMR